MDIIIRRLNNDERQAMKIPAHAEEGNGWSVWECEPSRFNWHYEEEETAYLYSGRVLVRTNSGVSEIKAGDYVIFPGGLSCQWDVLEHVVKVYRFKK